MDASAAAVVHRTGPSCTAGSPAPAPSLASAVERHHLQGAVHSLAPAPFAEADECPPSPDNGSQEERGNQGQPLALVTLAVEVNHEDGGVERDDRAPSHAPGHACDPRRALS